MIVNNKMYNKNKGVFLFFVALKLGVGWLGLLYFMAWACWQHWGLTHICNKVGQGFRSHISLTFILVCTVILWSSMFCHEQWIYLTLLQFFISMNWCCGNLFLRWIVSTCYYCNYEMEETSEVLPSWYRWGGLYL